MLVVLLTCSYTERSSCLLAVFSYRRDDCFILVFLGINMLLSSYFSFKEVTVYFILMVHNQPAH